jgi:predicted ATPase
MILFEDAQWSDPTSLELFDLIIDRVSTLRVLLIVTFRPEFNPPWTGRPHVSLLALNRLPPRQRAEMIAGITGGKALPEEIAAQIIDRTDGVPLFVEELTKAVVESGMLTDIGDRYTTTGPAPALAIPASLQASLLARLDRLAPVREVAQIGAALGRIFSHELIGAVARMPPAQLDDALGQLVGAELVYRRGTRPTLNTPSSTRWCRMPLTARYCGAGGSSFMPASPSPSKAGSRRLSQPSLHCSRTTARKPGW